MKIKLLTICLLLFTSQVFAEEKIIKCQVSDNEHWVYKYSESFFGLFKKIQYRDEIEWKDWCPKDGPDNYESRELEKSSYGVRCTTVHADGIYDKKQLGQLRKNIGYIDFIQPKKKSTIIFKDGETRHINYKCSFIE